jgi:hypothetical protein
MPSSDGDYEEPSDYAHLDSSTRVTIDANYQSLIHAKAGKVLPQDIHNLILPRGFPLIQIIKIQHTTRLKVVLKQWKEELKKVMKDSPL